MTESEEDILKMLFGEHHRQLAEKRQKIHSVTEKTLAILVLIAGWIVFTKDPMTRGVGWVIIGVALVLAIGASRSIVVNNNSYHAIAQVVGRINNGLGLHTTNKFDMKEPIYPDDWKEYGRRGKIKGALFHIIAIAAGAVLCGFAAFMRT